MTRRILTPFHLQLLMVMGVLTVLAFAKTPADYAMIAHWDEHNVADWVLPRQVGFLVLPVVAAVSAGLVATYGLVVRNAVLEMGRHVIEPMMMYFLLMLDALQLGLLLTGFGSDIDLVRIVAGGMSVAFLFLGILLREAERHSYAGLRLPWQIRDDAAFALSHQVAGWLWITGGIGVAALTWLAPQPATLIFGLLVTTYVPLLAGMLVSAIGMGRAKPDMSTPPKS